MNCLFSFLKEFLCRIKIIFFTSESVSEGHPDKICDRISDEIVDMIYKEAQKTGTDPWLVRVACETLVSVNRVVIAGEVRVPDTLLKKDKNKEFIYDKTGFPLINPTRFRTAARRAIRAIGYEQTGFHWKTVKLMFFCALNPLILQEVLIMQQIGMVKKEQVIKASCLGMLAVKRLTLCLRQFIMRIRFSNFLPQPAIKEKEKRVN